MELLTQKYEMSEEDCIDLLDLAADTNQMDLVHYFMAKMPGGVVNAEQFVNTVVKEKRQPSPVLASKQPPLVKQPTKRKATNKAVQFGRAALRSATRMFHRGH